jgi:ParB family chromosome partitioning protein
VASAEEGPLTLTELPLNVISTNRHQPRKAFDEEALASLTASVRELGVLQPILVRPMPDDKYELIAGERPSGPASRRFPPSCARSTTPPRSNMRWSRTSTARI